MSYPYDEDDRPQRAVDWGQVQFSDFSNVNYFQQQPDSDDEAINGNGMLYNPLDLPKLHPLHPEVKCHISITVDCNAKTIKSRRGGTQWRRICPSI
jgi:hypothetical protein